MPDKTEREERKGEAKAIRKGERVQKRRGGKRKILKQTETKEAQQKRKKKK